MVLALFAPLEGLPSPCHAFSLLLPGVNQICSMGKRCLIDWLRSSFLSWSATSNGGKTPPLHDSNLPQHLFPICLRNGQFRAVVFSLMAQIHHRPPQLL